jgi:ferrochelatase
MTGVLVVNLGTPDQPTRSAVYRYLKQFLLDPRVIDINPIARNLLVRLIIAPFRSGKSAKAYEKIWTKDGSPLKIYGYRLVEMLRERLGRDYVVELGMRYQNPSIESALQALLRQNIDKLIVFPLFPQYASATTGSVHEEVMRLLAKEQIILPTVLLSDYYQDPKMIEAFVARAADHPWQDYDHILFSYHGLPQRQLRKADRNQHCLQKPNCCAQITEDNRFCYSAQCYATTEAIAKALGLPKERYTTCFQSRLGRDPWIQPYTSDVLKERRKAGDKRLLVFCPAFVADCLETIVEISEEYAEEFEELGGEHVQLVEGLNDHPLWADAVTQLIQQH